MIIPLDTHVVAVEKLCDGVVITFDDGLSVAFSPCLLRSALAYAETLWELRAAGASQVAVGQASAC